MADVKEQAEELEQSLIENTSATEQNTRASEDNRRSDRQSRYSKTVDGLILVMCIAATVFLSRVSINFAENQAGIVISGIASGILGATMPRRGVN